MWSQMSRWLLRAKRSNENHWSQVNFQPYYSIKYWQTSIRTKFTGNILKKKKMVSSLNSCRFPFIFTSLNLGLVMHFYIPICIAVLLLLVQRPVLFVCHTLAFCLQLLLNNQLQRWFDILLILTQLLSKSWIFPPFRRGTLRRGRGLAGWIDYGNLSNIQRGWSRLGDSEHG